MTIFLTFAEFPPLESVFSTENLSDFLGEQEKIEWDRLKVPKRKREWLSARLIVKKLIRASIPELEQVPFSKIQILKEPSGAPFILVENGKQTRVEISFSHSHEHVFAACSSEDIRFGTDLEWIESRSKEFVEDYFTENEIRQVLSSDPDQADLITTVIWSAKEAVLKALRTGLSLDTRKIEIGFTTEPSEKEGWLRLEIKPPSRLLWRREGDFVETLCILEKPEQDLRWVASANDQRSG